MELFCLSFRIKYANDETSGENEWTRIKLTKNRDVWNRQWHYLHLSQMSNLKQVPLLCASENSFPLSVKKCMKIGMTAARVPGKVPTLNPCPFLRSVILSYSSHNSFKLAHSKELRERKGLDKTFTWWFNHYYMKI